MAKTNTYTQIHLHIIYAVKYRAAVIHPTWKEELYKYTTGIVQNAGHKLLIMNGVADHVHLLIGMRPNQALSDLMKHVKSDSSEWINNKGFANHQFNWQEGFGAFSYAMNDLPNVIRYIENQEEHHRQKSFREEYIELLEKFQIAYDEKYIFRSLE